MAHWHAVVRRVSTSVHGSARAPGLRLHQLSAAPKSRIWLRRRRHAGALYVEGLQDADLEYALMRLGAYLLARGTRDLVQRVLRSIAARPPRDTLT
jgi:hypothetical protein